jgi:RNA polymerase sigma-70 factor (ECF subfamily)
VAQDPTRDPTFDELFLSLREKVFALALHVTGSQADAEDATQETFLAVHRALPSFRGDSLASTWVYRIALRAALRVRARRPKEASTSAGASHERALEDAAAGDAEAVLVARDSARRLEEAWERLTGEHRAVLSLFAVDGLSHREIAEVLGVPVGTVWSRLHAARKTLHAALAE